MTPRQQAEAVLQRAKLAAMIVAGEYPPDYWTPQRPPFPTK